MAALAISCTCEAWWAVTDSNRRHPACKAGALPTELTARRRRYRPARHSVQARCNAVWVLGHQSCVGFLGAGTTLRLSRACPAEGRWLEGPPLWVRESSQKPRKPRRAPSGEPASFSSRDAGSALAARTIDDLLAFSALRPVWGNGKEKERKGGLALSSTRMRGVGFAGCLTS